MLILVRKFFSEKAAMKNYQTKARFWLWVLLLILGNLAWAGAPDPGKPDTAYVEYGGMSQGVLTIKIMFVTDNVGDTNKIDGFSFPIRITNSNPAAKPVLDTSLNATYSGSAAKGFSALSTYVYSNKSNPSIFPLQYNLVALNLQNSPAIGKGRYLFANLKLRLEDTTTICVDTHRTETVSLFFLKPNNKKFFPKWNANCCQANSVNKSADVDRSKKRK